MAITVVGQGSVELNGVGTTAISVPAGTADGDDVFIQVTNEKASDSSYTPSSVSGLNSVYTVGKTTLYYGRISGTPPSDYTVNFGATSDVHGWIKIQIWRGAKLFNTVAYKNDISYAKINITSETLPAYASSVPGEIQLGFFGARNATLTVPSQETGIYGSLHTGAHPISVASGYVESPSRTVYNTQVVTLSAASNFDAIVLTMVPEGEVSAYDAFWTVRGPYLASNSGYWDSIVIFDTVGDYAYFFNDETLVKINRSNLSIIAQRTESTFFTSFAGFLVDQDDDYLYYSYRQAHYEEPGHVFTPDHMSYAKIAKADLSTVYIADSIADQNIEPSGLKRGRPGTWSQDLIFGIPYGLTPDTDGSLYNFVAWNVSDGTIAHQRYLPIITAPPASTDPEKGRYTAIAVDNNGDLWILHEDGNRGTPYTFWNQAAVTRVDSSYNLHGPYRITGMTISDGSLGEALAYDAANNALIAFSASTDFDNPQWSAVARYNITGNSTTYAQNYGGLWLESARANNPVGNELRGLFGVPSVFVDWYPEWLGVGNGVVSGIIAQYNHETGALIRTIDIPEGYNRPINAVLSPEGKLWCVVTDVTADNEYLLILDITGALDQNNNGIPDEEEPGGGASIIPHILGYGMSGQMLSPGLG